jgi:hypothetical protein
MSKGKSIATFVQSAELPAHLRDANSGLGNENVGSGDLQMSRLDLIQQLSPQIEKDNPAYLEGAELGHIFDSATGDLYESVFVVNLYFDKRFQVFKKRKFGGGFEGSYMTEDAARQYLEDENLPVDQYDIVETDIHACLMLDAEGKPKKPCVIYMSGSKAKVSRKWNTALSTQEADRFASVWALSSVKEKNKQGQPYQNFKVDFAGWASEDLYEEAKKNYLAFRGKQEQ